MAKRSRTERREAEREAVKLAKARVKLASLEAGGASDRPIEVTSASTVEPHASSVPCAACGASGVRVDAHEARTVGEPPRHLRVVRARCPRCGHVRELFFRIVSALPS